MSALIAPNPISQVIAFSLSNENAYDHNLIVNLIENHNNLEDSFIPIQQVNFNYTKAQSFGYQLLGHKASLKFLEKFDNIFKSYKNINSIHPQWDDLIAPNIYSLCLLHDDFSSKLSEVVKSDFLAKAKIRFLIGNLINKNPQYNYSNSNSKIKIIDQLNKEQIDTTIEENFIPFDMTFKDFSLMILLAKTKEYNFKLKESDLHFLAEDEQVLISQTYSSKKPILPIVIQMLDNQSITPYIFKKIGVINDYNIDKENVKYLIHDITSEANLSTILNNLSGNHKIKQILDKDIHLIKEIWPIIWNKFTHKDYEQDSLSFLRDPDKIYTVLYKLGVLKTDVLEKDKDSNYFLSNYMLDKASTKIIDNLMEKGFYDANFLKTKTSNELWESIISNKKNDLYIAIQDNLKVSIFDVAPQKYHVQILNNMVENISEYHLDFAINRPDFDINLIDTIIKVKNKPSTFLHKVLIKGYNDLFINLLSKGANYNIPEGNSVLDFMENKAKYSNLLLELKPILLHKEFQEKIPLKEPSIVKKVKI